MKEYQRDLSPIEDAAWGLLYSMIEVGSEPDSSPDSKSLWWSQEFYRLKRALEQRGLNCDPK